MRNVLRSWRGVLLAGMCVIFLLGPSPAQAQSNQNAGALSGVVLDPEGKAVVNATVLVRNEASADLRTTMTDASGHFSVRDLLAGAYIIEVAVPGFDVVFRNGVQVSSTGSEEMSIRLSIANISESVTVSAALPDAAVGAPSQSSLLARSAQALISPQYIRNYTAPGSH